MNITRLKLFLPIVCCILLPLLLLAASGGHVRLRHCGDQHHWPTIVVNKRIDNSHYQDHIPSYGQDITLLCSSSNASNLAIREEEYQQIVEQLNSTTIQVIVKNPDVGMHRYHCTDINTNCSVSLIKYIKPAMSVEAPRVHYRLNKEEGLLYFVSREEDYNVSCTGNDANSLSIKATCISWQSLAWKQVKTMKINMTTITAAVTNDNEADHYLCESEITGLVTTIPITRDYFPEAQALSCLKDDQRKLLICNWRSTSEKNTYDLFIGSTRLCSYSSGEVASGCIRALDTKFLGLIFGMFSLQVRTCNAVFCNNQTFFIETDNITKLAPVHDLKATNISSRGVAVTWRQLIWDWVCQYKVEYRLLGLDWRQVNGSMGCQFSGYRDRALHYTCQLQLLLPCPDVHYELRVYVKHRRATDEHWSEPTHVYFFTAPGTDEMLESLDLACNAEFVARTPPVTAEAAFDNVQKLINDVHKRRKSLKKLVGNLKLKMAKIKDLMNKQT